MGRKELKLREEELARKEDEFNRKMRAGELQKASMADQELNRMERQTEGERRAAKVKTEQRWRRYEEEKEAARHRSGRLERE